MVFSLSFLATVLCQKSLSGHYREGKEGKLAGQDFGNLESLVITYHRELNIIALPKSKLTRNSEMIIIATRQRLCKMREMRSYDKTQEYK